MFSGSLVFRRIIYSTLSGVEEDTALRGSRWMRHVGC